MSRELAWANLAFQPPWAQDTNHSWAHATSSHRLDGTSPSCEGRHGVVYQNATAGRGESTLEAKESGQTDFEGIIFYNLLVGCGVAILHGALCKVLAWWQDAPETAQPGSMRMPCWELWMFQAQWTPITLGSSVAFFRTVNSYAVGFEDTFYISLAVLVVLAVQALLQLCLL